MDLNKQLTEDLKVAMKSGDKIAMETIRGLKSMLRDKEIELKRDLQEDDQTQVLSTAAKRRRESIESYQEGGREDLVKQEQAELQVIEKYLPEQLSEEEIRSLVDETIAATGAQTMQDMGKVMGTIMPKVRGKAESGFIQQIVREKLS